ncbi:MAG: hypothetical protein ACLQOZ_14965 [Acidimicrobiales bacterium]|jgi:hypothetical protein
MGFLDKVKAQATVLADKAQTGVQQGQVKLAEMQASKQEDHLLRQLGAYVFLSERDRPQPDGEAKVAELMSQLDALETAGAVVSVTPDPAAVPPGGAVPQAGPAPVDGAVPQAGTVPQPAPPAPPVADPVPTAAAPGAVDSVPPAGGAIPKSGGGLPGQ